MHQSDGQVYFEISKSTKPGKDLSMTFRRHQNTLATPTPTAAAKESFAKKFGAQLLTAAFAFLLASILHGAGREGMVVLAIWILAAPTLIIVGGVSFVRHRIIGETFKCICVFGAVFIGTLLLYG